LALQTHRRLIVFGRYPVPGRTKTRLIPALGPAGAADLQRQFTERIIGTALKARIAPVQFSFTGGTPRQVRRWLAKPELRIERQSDGDLGRRMHTAMASAFDGGNRLVVLVGTDVPTATAGHLQAAFDALRTSDMVLGPSNDGGYWLIGLRQPADVFSDITWGSHSVLDQTLAAGRRLKLRIAQLDPLQDIDIPSDLASLPAAAKTGRPYLSVVIPALNEGDTIEAAIESARSDDSDIIVVDGGSRDRTAARAADAGARVIPAPRGRAVQMNRGARKAGGSVLLFLHADCRLPHGYSSHVFETLMDSRTIAGAFRFRTDYPARSMRLIEKTVHLRSTWFQMPYGDQGLFLRNDVFQRMGGFSPVPIAEDLFLVRRLARMGRIRLARVAVVTSGRRWRRIGVWRATLINYLIAGGCLMRIPARTLAPLYALWTADRSGGTPNRK
jgi:rSAM/selenodomain-associated transferase 2/rSAM/selenodomain-associated transferase 1